MYRVSSTSPRAGSHTPLVLEPNFGSPFEPFSYWCSFQVCFRLIMVTKNQASYRWVSRGLCCLTILHWFAREWLYANFLSSLTANLTNAVVALPSSKVSRLQDRPLSNSLTDGLHGVVSGLVAGLQLLILHVSLANRHSPRFSHPGSSVPTNFGHSSVTEDPMLQAPLEMNGRIEYKSKKVPRGGFPHQCKATWEET